MEKLLFELVSPERVLTSEPVSMVVVPGVEGYFGAMPRHSPLISGMAPGIVDVYQDGQIVRRLFVSGGVAEVNEERCTILADEAFPVEEITSALAEQRMAKARTALERAENEVARASAQKLVKIAEAMAAIAH